jgi:hypothetical protein
MFDPIVKMWKSVTTRHMRWRMRETAFRGAGSYTLSCGEDKITLEVASDRTFETKGKPALPLYPFASLI